MRIGIVAPPWLPVPSPGYGGTEVIVDRLARGFLAAGHDVLLWTTGDSSCPVPRAWCLDHARPERIGDAHLERDHARAGLDAMRSWGADVVHDHTLAGPRMAAMSRDLCAVTTCHGPLDAPDLAALYRDVGRRVPVIAISHDQASRGPGVRVARVIHHGIHVSEVPFGEGRGDRDDGYLLHVGRMSADKGICEAIEVARRAGRRLLLASKMREPAEIQFFAERVQPLLGDGVDYVGEVDIATRDALLAGADALLNPIQWNEPFGLVMIEAMAAGTPVVASRRGSAPEIVDDGVTGYVCDDLDVMVDAVRHVHLMDRTRVRRRVARRFSVDRMVRRHLALFQELVGERCVA